MELGLLATMVGESSRSEVRTSDGSRSEDTMVDEGCGSEVRTSDGSGSQDTMIDEGCGSEDGTPGAQTEVSICRPLQSRT